MSEDTYWCAKPTAEFCKAADEKIDRFYKWTRTSGLFATWQRMMQEYYAGAYSCGTTGTAGEQEEFTTIKENHLHSLGEHIVVMVTGSRPAFEPKAKNTDVKSIAQTQLASALLDQAFREKDLEGINIECVRAAGQFGESFGFCGWDPNRGTPYVANPDVQGRVEKTGDLVYESFLPIDVVRDPLKWKAQDHQWLMPRRQVNKWDLAARYPELKDRILGIQSSASDEQHRPRLKQPASETLAKYESDDVTVWYFYHERSDAMPQGRYVEFIAGDLWLYDGPLPYKTLPIERMAAEEMAGTQRGYSCFYDLLPLQHINSATQSLILSHISNYGTGVWWAPMGTTFTVEDLKGGFTLLKGGQQPPVALQPPVLPDYLPAQSQHTVQTMEALSGVNAVRRGTITNERDIKPQAAALLDAKAIEFSMGLQRANVRFLEAMGSATIRHYQTFAKTPQVALMAGKSNRSKLREFIGATDMPDVDRVTVDIGSPLSRTVSGRMQLCQMYLDMGPAGPIKTPEQIDQVLSTGKLEPAVESTRSRLANLRSENERLQDGQPCNAIATDMHPTHITEHLAVIDSPESRENPALLENALMHVQQHIDMWRTTDPAILAAVGCPPPPMAPMMPQPGGPGAPPQGGGDTPPPPDALPQPPGAGPQPQMPQMPVNPSTGERAPMPPSPMNGA